jgi:hypothetical protein
MKKVKAKRARRAFAPELEADAVRLVESGGRPARSSRIAALRGQREEPQPVRQ